MADEQPEHAPEPGPTETRLISGPSGLPSLYRSTGRAADTAPARPAGPLPERVGRFEVRACLGAGAFGWVYRAFDPTLRREVAIKLPRAERLRTPGDRARFLTEARAAATIRHPHVVPVFEIGEADGTPFIVMGYVPGETLADILAERGGPFPTHEAARIVASLALAVQAAHDRGVVHRDLKPANVLFDPDHGEYVVSDFGLARVTDPDDPKESTTGVAGTPSYMPPEQARGDSAAVGPRSDVYALGVMLFELLTGKLPFTGGSVAEVIARVLTAPPPPASTLAPGVPPGLDAVCRQAMAKAPDDRFASAQDLAAALGPFLSPELTAALMQTVDLAPPPAPRPAPKPRRKWAWVAVLAVAVLGAATALGFALWPGPKPVPAPHPAAPPRTPDPSPPARAESADRRAAEWVLRSGGTVKVLDARGTRLTPQSAAELPAELRVTRVTLPYKTDLTDEAVRGTLRGLSGLEDARFDSCKGLTDAGLAELARLPALAHLTIKFCPRVTDAGAAAFARHPALREFYASGSKLTPTGVAAVATAPHLEALSVHGHAITDAWLAAAAGATGLHQLYCGYSNDRPGAGVTADGLKHLAPLRHLYLLDLDSAALEPGALKGLPDLPALDQLYVRKTTVADADLPELMRFPKLFALGLHHTAVTDAGMATVAQIPNLKQLHLDGTSVTDAGLKTLRACKKLEHLSVAGTKVSPAAVAAFCTALPRCEVNTVPHGD
ncbi:protein kinase domain-containing protein [Gemmata sp.]|uniref:protein kinase domain-containing protein n=1 Tax=Gemmata sp. TaxID=1914242 RepID=UPI003F705F9E